MSLNVAMNISVEVKGWGQRPQSGNEGLLCAAGKAKAVCQPNSPLMRSRE
jgi:hypothetical protein